MFSEGKTNDRTCAHGGCEGKWCEGRPKEVVVRESDRIVFPGRLSKVVVRERWLALTSHFTPPPIVLVRRPLLAFLGPVRSN